MKKSIVIPALVALFSLSMNAQEPSHKVANKKECASSSKKCCAKDAKKSCSTAEAKKEEVNMENGAMRMNPNKK